MFKIFQKKKVDYNFYVIDDEADVLEIIVDLIETTFSCQVHSFTKIDDLLNKLKKNPLAPDLIFSDVKLGSESGWHLKDKVTALGYNIPILYITGLTGAEGFSNGYWSINKPVSKNSLEKYTNLVLEEAKKKKAK